MDDSKHFYAVPSAWCPLTRAVSLLFVHDQHDVIEIDRFATQVLEVCRGYREFRLHANAVMQAGLSSDRRAVARVMSRLVDLGLLRHIDHFSPSELTRSETEESEAINVVAIVTADRPKVMSRCLESLLCNCDISGSRPRIMIVDGSRETSNREANELFCVAMARTTGHSIEYVGPLQANALRRRLAAAGIPESTLSFGMSPGGTGANRNIAMVLARGEALLMLDDDIVCTLWTLEDRDDGLTIGGHSELRDGHFFRNRREALAATRGVSMSLLKAHSTLLGRSLIGLLSDFSHHTPNLENACGHLLSAVDYGREFRVRATFAGIAGDSGVGCPYQILFASGSTKERLCSDGKAFRTALTSREILRVARRHTVVHQTGCMAGCMALSRRAILPPFMPAGRNEDGLFGAMLSWCDSSALFGHLSYGVVHDSHRPSQYNKNAMPSATEVRTADILIAMTRRILSSCVSEDPVLRLRHLAACLCETGKLDEPEFKRWVTRLAVEDRARGLAAVEANMSVDGTYPDYWRKALGKYRRAFRRSISIPEFYIPVELQNSGTAEAAFAGFRQYIHEFGELIKWWPQILDYARATETAADHV